ncbi:MAG: PorV/PorQ family protein [Candidatus Neomarinimicrobiota bacterium]
MKKFSLPTMFTLTLVIVGLMVSSAFSQEDEQEKRAQTGMKFLSFSVDARAAALGNAMTADDQGSAASMFYNPASMARLNSTVGVVLGMTQWIADINYNAAGVTFRPSGGLYGVFGLSLLSVDYGDITETIRSDVEAGYEDVGTFSPSALAIGVGYAHALTDQFSVGGNVKYVKEDLGKSVMRFDDNDNLEREDNIQSTVAFDFGVLYHTGFRSLNFAMSARNFSRDLTYAEETFELPLSFRIGIGMDLIDFTGMDRDMHSFLLSIDTERPRDFDEMIRVGGEYLFMNTLAVRGGYAFPTDEQGINFGVGVQRGFGNLGLHIDYAYTQFGVFDNVNRVALQLSF